jgi:hypothetical protein
MKNLIIHPNDATTKFIIPSYAVNDCTVISNYNLSRSALRKDIIDHDRIICIGHGLPTGLLNPKYITSLWPHYIIDSRFVQILRNKECILIWCNADQFQKKYNIPGLATGMVITEYSEADYLCITYAPGDLQQSNEILVSILTQYFFNFDKIKRSDFDLYPDNKILNYNLDSLNQFFI